MTRPTVEERARRHLWLFPAWVRADRGEEAVGLVLDLLAPDAHRLPLRSRVDLVRAGLHARRVGTPPLWVWLDVLTASPRNARGRVPERWRAWLHQWTSAKGWSVRQAAASVALVMAIPLALVACGWRVGGIAVLPFYVAGRCAFRAPAWRQRIWERNGFASAPAGAPAPRLFYAVRNRPAVPALGRWAVVASALAAAGTTFGAVWERPRPSLGSLLPSMVLALVVGWVLIWVGTRSLAGTRPEPHRWHVNDSRADRWALGAWTPVVCVISVGVGAEAAPLTAAAAVALLVLRHRAVRRGRALGRPIDLWEVVPLLGPGATVPLPPERTPAEQRRRD